jgi:hypothetical protein
MRKKFSAIALSTLSALALGPAWAGSEGVTNTWYGQGAANALTSGTSNSFFGAYAGQLVTTGGGNVAMGYAAGTGSAGASGNTAIGVGAGYGGGSYNVFLGYGAGRSESGSHRLSIDNCFYYVTQLCDRPFIYGEFDNRLLALDGSLHVFNKTTGLGRSQLHFSHTGGDVGGWLTSVGDNNFFMSSGARYEGIAGGWIQRSPDGNAVIAGSSGAGYKIFTSTGVSVGGVASSLLTRFHIDYSGNIGLNTYVIPGIAIATGTGAYLSAGGVWTNASSRALKEDIRELSTRDALRTLEGLRPVSFRYRDTDGEAHVGFIAEDVPDLVATRDRKGVSAMDVVAVLTRVVKEQQEQLAELAAEVRRMRDLR